MAKKNKEQKKEIYNSSNSKNMIDINSKEIIITKNHHKKLESLINKEFPREKFEIVRENEEIIPTAWISRTVQHLNQYHPHPNIWVIDPKENALNELIKLIDSSSEMICICSFLINNTKIIDA